MILSSNIREYSLFVNYKCQDAKIYFWTFKQEFTIGGPPYLGTLLQDEMISYLKKSQWVTCGFV
jgi:hypothetical protein